MLRFLVLTVSLLGAGCQGGTVHPEFVGEFEVATRDGREMPATVPTVVDGQPCVNDLLESKLSIRSNGTWSEMLKFQHRCGPDGTDVRPSITLVESGDTTAQDNPRRIMLTSDDMEASGSKQEAVMEGNGMRMTFTSSNADVVMVFTYRRVS